MIFAVIGYTSVKFLLSCLAEMFCFSADDLMRWLKSFSMSLELISAAIDTLQQLGSSDDVKQTQV